MPLFYQDEYVTIIHDDCRYALDAYDFGHVHCCVTSPPYWGLRDYGSADQIGLEPTPAEYISTMTGVFSAMKSVLRSDGTLWINIGDSYFGDSPARKSSAEGFSKTWNSADSRGNGGTRRSAARIGDLKPKDLIGIPWMLAFALRADGYWLRSDVIWSKLNCMPESVTDRLTRSHEYIFLLTKSRKYFFDNVAIAEPSGTAGQVVSLGERSFAKQQADGAGVDPTGNGNAETYTVKATRNKRSVWNVSTSPFKGAHFATFPPKLIEPCILAGVPETICSVCGAPYIRIVESRSADARRLDKGQPGRTGNGRGRGVDDLTPLASITIGFKATCTCNGATEPGTVIDPLGGAGTTGVVAKQHRRRAIIIEQKEEYCQMAADRIAKVVPLVKEQPMVD